jgi:hypothetical protein
MSACVFLAAWLVVVVCLFIGWPVIKHLFPLEKTEKMCSDCVSRSCALSGRCQHR